jgi:hypothetical protein
MLFDGFEMSVRQAAFNLEAVILPARWENHTLDAA